MLAYKVHKNAIFNSTACSELSGTDIINAFEYQTIKTVIDEKADERHLMITYKNGDICPYNEDEFTMLNYQLSINLKCNPLIP